MLVFVGCVAAVFVHQQVYVGAFSKLAN